MSGKAVRPELWLTQQRPRGGAEELQAVRQAGGIKLHIVLLLVLLKVLLQK